MSELAEYQRRRQRTRRVRALIHAALGGGGGHISFSPGALADNAPNGTAVGTASIVGTTTGTASWSLANSAGGKYAINSSSGAVTVAGALSAGTDTITIAVSGVTPAVANASFDIPVTAATGSQSLDFSDPDNSQYIPII